MDDLSNYVDILIGGLSVSAIIYTWLSARSKANSSSIAQIEMSMSSKSERLALVEQRLHTLEESRQVDRQVQDKIFNRIDTLTSVTSRLEGHMGAKERQLGVIHNALIGKANE